MNYKRFNIKALLVLPLVLGLIASPSMGGEKKGDNGDKNVPFLGKSLTQEAGIFDGNRVYDDFENNGMIVSHRPSGHSGMEWPRNSQNYSNFASGVWIGGKVDGVIGVTAGEYGGEFVAGPLGSNPNDPSNRIYKINRNVLNSVIDGALDPATVLDILEWPAVDGAPYIDVDGDGAYDATAGDYPDILGDQFLWHVANDGDVAAHAIFASAPFNIETQVSIWGFDSPLALGDMMFVKYVIINKGEADITDTYITLWDDPDLGNAGDDFVACDTVLSLGYCYNDGPDLQYGDGGGAIGYDFFQGPIVASVGDTALVSGRLIPGFRNLPMSSFIKFINTSDPNWNDPADQFEAYNLQSGLKKTGLPFTNGETGANVKFMYPDHPRDGQGAGNLWADSDDHPASDRRFMMNSGPFTLAKGDTQEVVFGIFHALGADPFGSIDLLKINDEIAQFAYDNGFPLTPNPPPPIVTTTVYDGSIILEWENRAESYSQADVLDVSTTPDTWDFEGYNVWQYQSATGDNAKLVATYDLINGVTNILDNVFVPDLGEIVMTSTQHGKDSGVKRFIVLSTDAYSGLPLINNRAYFYSVTAYAYNANGVPKAKENSAAVMTIRPAEQLRLSGLASVGDGDFTVTHNVVTGGVKSAGSMNVSVENPAKITGHDYEVRFRYDTTGTVLWDGIDVTTGETVITGNTIQGGVDVRTNSSAGANAAPIADGLHWLVQGPAKDWTNFEMVANAAGPISPTVGAAADFQSFPVPSRPGASQQVGDGRWMFNAGGGSGSYSSFLGRAMRNNNFDDVVPFDFEMRFTARGSWAINWFVNDFVNKVPFELWNIGIGTLDDKSDDIRMIPYFLDLAALGATVSDTNNVYQYQVEPNDHGTSGGFNDPYTPWIYWVMPDDDGAGEGGYDAFIGAIDTTVAYGTNGNLSFTGGEEFIARSILVDWNGFLGTTDPASTTWSPTTWADSIAMAQPETGSIIRLTSTKTNGPDDSFAFSTATKIATTEAYDIKRVSLWPNPYFAFNPEEPNPGAKIVTFTNLPEVATIRVFTLSGDLVAKIDHSGGTVDTWNVANMFNVPVASGMYIVHIDGDAEGTIIHKLGVVQAAERLNVF